MRHCLMLPTESQHLVLCDSCSCSGQQPHLHWAAFREDAARNVLLLIDSVSAFLHSVQTVNQSLLT